LAFNILIAIAIGLVAGLCTVQVFRRGWIPEFLKAPLVLGVLLTCFAGANIVQEETGLLAVTVLGLVIGNAHLMAIDEIRRFQGNPDRHSGFKCLHHPDRDIGMVDG
ncbi:MAG TPA: hypothetical protein DHR80_09365, partial [Thalassospira lucentensis]|nr:hypothetical protein [Thalassospira lucentensis]